MTETLPFLQNREAEEAVLGAVLINPEMVHELSFLKSCDFFLHRNRFVWDAVCALVRDNSPIDAITLGDELQRQGKLNEVGGPAYLTGLMANVPYTFNASEYAHIVQDHAKRRAGIQIAEEIANAAANMKQEFDLASYTAKLLADAKISTRREGRDVLGDMFDDLYSPTVPMTFGIGDMDTRLGGMFPKELTILAGDQGTGKSSLMLWIARKNAEMGRRVLLVSLEMKAKSLFFRMACGDLGVNWNQVRSGRVPDEVRDQVWQMAQYLEEKYRGLFVVYEDPMTLTDVQAAANREAPNLVFIDHVGLISGQRETRGGVDKIDQMNGVNRFLRQDIAKPLSCHVMLLWQLNRSAFRENRKPTKHDLFMAGTQDPDSILLLYRADLYQEDVQLNPPTRPVDLDVIIGKARNDFTGIVPCKYDLQHQAFSGLERRIP